MTTCTLHVPPSIKGSWAHCSKTLRRQVTRAVEQIPQNSDFKQFILLTDLQCEWSSVGTTDLCYPGVTWASWKPGITWELPPSQVCRSCWLLAEILAGAGPLPVAWASLQHGAWDSIQTVCARGRLYWLLWSRLESHPTSLTSTMLCLLKGSLIRLLMLKERLCSHPSHWRNISVTWEKHVGWCSYLWKIQLVTPPIRPTGRGFYELLIEHRVFFPAFIPI